MEEFHESSNSIFLMDIMRIKHDMNMVHVAGKSTLPYFNIAMKKHDFEKVDHQMKRAYSFHGKLLNCSYPQFWQTNMEDSRPAIASQSHGIPYVFFIAGSLPYVFSFHSCHSFGRNYRRVFL